MSSSAPSSAGTGTLTRASDTGITAPPTWRARLAKFRSVVKRIIGVPDYEEYLAHMQRQYPECTPMDPRTFERERLAAKYRLPGSRCC